jgi:hypothetical protein
MDEKEEENTQESECDRHWLYQGIACRQLSKLKFDGLIKKVLDKAASDCWVPYLSTGPEHLSG